MAFESGLDVLMREGAAVMGSTIRSIVAGLGEKIGGLLSRSEPAQAASSERSSGGFLSRMMEAISSGAPESEATSTPQKCGRSKDFHNGDVAPLTITPFHASIDTIEVPSVPMALASRGGASVGVA